MIPIYVYLPLFTSEPSADPVYEHILQRSVSHGRFLVGSAQVFDGFFLAVEVGGMQRLLRRLIHRVLTEFLDQIRRRVDRIQAALVDERDALSQGRSLFDVVRR